MPEKEGEKIMEVMVSYERRGLEKGLEKGKEQGIKQGIEQGVKQGIKEGRAKGKTDIARNMLRKGLDTELIAEMTGLTENEVVKLAKEQNNR